MVFGQIPKVIGFIYALVLIVVVAYLWYSGRWQKKIGWLLLVISAALGFLIFAPVLPWQFQQLVLRDVQGMGAPLIVGAIGLILVFLLTLLFGRFFCGYLCPVGAVQEIAYHAPVPKINSRRKNTIMAVRAAFFIVFLAMAFFLSASLLAWFGIRDFFYLILTAGTFLFSIIVVLSITWYRPFCRLVCPFGALLSIGAGKSRLRLQRIDACIECKACEKACPTDEAKRDDRKAECYLCGRCIDACPTRGAIMYKRWNVERKK